MATADSFRMATDAPGSLRIAEDSLRMTMKSFKMVIDSIKMAIVDTEWPQEMTLG